MELEARLRAFAAVAGTARSPGLPRRSTSASRRSRSTSPRSRPRSASSSSCAVARASRLTPAGELLADYVLRAEALLANAGARARRGRGRGASGRSRSPRRAFRARTSSPSCSPAFDERFPASRSTSAWRRPAEALELVRAHEVELAVVGGLDVPAGARGRAAGRGRDRAGRAALARRVGGSARRISKRLTWISREEGSPRAQRSRRRAGSSGCTPCGRWSSRRGRRSSSRSRAARASRRSAGFALDLELEAGTLAVLDVPRWRVSRTISLVTARDVPLTPPAARFLELLREA